MMDAREDKLAIAEVIQNWAIWRDTGDWENLRSTFHADGTMTATWFTGTADEFIAGAKAGWSKPSRSAHFIGGSAIQIAGTRALAETRIILQLRDTLDDVEVDVTCYGRFYDRFEKREGAWKILRRGVIYEKDRIDPVRPGAALRLNDDILRRFPEGYRHVAYVQTIRGLKVATDRPTPRSPELEQLYGEAKAWLRSG
jgi:SnoaL-like domain